MKKRLELPARRARVDDPPLRTRTITHSTPRATRVSTINHTPASLVKLIVVKHLMRRPRRPAPRIISLRRNMALTR